MNWLAFAIATWVLFGLELGLRDLLQLGPQPIAPSFVFPLVVFVALMAPHRTTLWAALILGLLTDLTRVVTTDGGNVTVVGPYALGYLLGAQFVLTVRGLVIRHNPLTMVPLAILAGAIAQVVVTALHTMRAIYDPVQWAAVQELLWRLLAALYTGGTAFALSLVLFPLAGVFGFVQQTQGRGAYPRRRSPF